MKYAILYFLLGTFHLSLNAGVNSIESPSGSYISAFQVQMNLSGFECGKRTDSFTAKKAITAPYLSYWAGVGIKVVRLPIKWERIQPELGGPLDSGYLGLVKTFIKTAESNGIQVIIDLHNYGKYAPAVGSKIKLGEGDLRAPYENYGIVWSLLANEFKKTSNIAGYDIMNEPVGLASPQVWVDAAQVAIDAIRSTGDLKTPVYVEGYSWSNCNNWTIKNSTLHTLKDPANNLIFSCHNYMNQGRDANIGNWTTGNSVTDLEQQLQCPNCFGTWIKTYGFRGHIGESGVGQDPGFLIGLTSSTEAYQSLNMPLAYWNGGACTGVNSYTNTSVAPKSFSAIPKGTTLQTWPAEGIAPQLTEVLQNFINGSSQLSVDKITDKNGNIWTLGVNGVVNVNNRPIPGSTEPSLNVNISKVLYLNKSIYITNNANWYMYQNWDWVPTTDPQDSEALVPSPDGSYVTSTGGGNATIGGIVTPSVSQGKLIDNGLNIWTINRGVLVMKNFMNPSGDWHLSGGTQIAFVGGKIWVYRLYDQKWHEYIESKKTFKQLGVSSPMPGL